MTAAPALSNRLAYLTHLRAGAILAEARWGEWAVVAVLALCLAFGGGTAKAEDPKSVTDLERFALWADCAPMAVFISLRDTTDDGPKLTEASVRAAVESRLRSARLYRGDFSLPLLEVGASRTDNVLSPFLIRLELYKLMLDQETGLRLPASFMPPWAASFGRGSPEYVRSALAESIDKFLVEYLRVNEAACEAGSP